jgi:hypothetical protein
MGRVSLSEVGKRLEADAVELARVAWEKTRDCGMANVDTIKAQIVDNVELFISRTGTANWEQVLTSAFGLRCVPVHSGG